MSFFTLLLLRAVICQSEEVQVYLSLCLPGHTFRGSLDISSRSTISTQAAREGNDVLGRGRADMEIWPGPPTAWLLPRKKSPRFWRTIESSSRRRETKDTADARASGRVGVFLGCGNLSKVQGRLLPGHTKGRPICLLCRSLKLPRKSGMAAQESPRPRSTAMAAHGCADIMLSRYTPTARTP